MLYFLPVVQFFFLPISIFRRDKARDQSRQDKNTAILPALPFSIGHSFFPAGDTFIAPAKKNFTVSFCKRRVSGYEIRAWVSCR
jgi:hypothetical protein